MTQDKQPIIQAIDLKKVYIRGSEHIPAVDGITIEIKQGDYFAFVGPSGSGKTTLLHLLGCLDNPTAGTLKVADRIVYDKNKVMNERDLTKLRRELFGYVFQKFYLIPTLTVRENIMLPFAFYQKEEADKTANRLADMLGIGHRLNHLPKELSGGEMQRVAVARALINKPQILLADEPTGNLDSKRSEEISGIFKQLNQDEGITIILVTHNPLMAASAGKKVELKDGRLV
jgi:putative ABC transport system ATP-binding protein